MKTILATMIIATAVAFWGASVSARDIFGPTRIWITIEAFAGETRWQACRRVFGRAVHRVRKGPGDTMRCWVDYGAAY